jgi:hypothetical protein
MFFLFFTHLGIGLLACMLLVPLQKLGRPFFTLNSLLVLAFLVLALATRWSRGQPLPREIALCVALAAAYAASIRFRSNAVSLLLLGAAVAAGGVSIWREASLLAALPEARLSVGLLSAHFFTSALLLGSVTLDMILGHFYLVVPKLSFGPLRRLTLAFAVALGLRLVVSAYTLVRSWDVWSSAWKADSTRFLLQYGFFLTLRVLFGIVGPVVLVYLVWECVRIRSNQSATGILYVATAIVLIGEIASKYFLTTAAILL